MGQWRDIDIDKALDDYGTQQGWELAQLERVVQHRQTLAIADVAVRLEGVGMSVKHARDSVVTKADELLAQARVASTDQAKQQRALFRLSVVIAGATIVYTVITGWSLYVQTQANAIQCAQLAAGNHAAPASVCGTRPTQ